MRPILSQNALGKAAATTTVVTFIYAFMLLNLKSPIELERNTRLHACLTKNVTPVRKKKCHFRLMRRGVVFFFNS